MTSSIIVDLLAVAFLHRMVDHRMMVLYMVVPWLTFFRRVGDRSTINQLKD
jgi:hypothetical protein